MPDASVATTTAQVITLAARPTPLPTDHTLPRLVPRTKLQVKFQPTARTTFELGSLSHRNYPSMDDLLALPAESVVHWALAGQSPPDLERGVDLASDLGVRAFAACIRLLGMCHSHWDVEWKNMVPFRIMSQEDGDAPEMLYRRSIAALRWRVRSIGAWGGNEDPYLTEEAQPMYSAVDQFLASVANIPGATTRSPLPVAFWRAVGRDILSIAVKSDEPLLLFVDEGLLKKYPGTQGVTGWYMENDVTSEDYSDSDEEDYSLDDDGYRELQCEACEDFNVPLRYFGRYYTPEGLQRHMQNFHSPIADAYRWINTLNHSYMSGSMWRVSKYKCPVLKCPIWYNTRTQLVYHILSRHAHEGRIPNLPCAHILTLAEVMASQNNVHGETAKQVIPHLRRQMEEEEKERSDDERFWRMNYPLAYH